MSQKFSRGALAVAAMVGACSDHDLPQRSELPLSTDRGSATVQSAEDSALAATDLLPEAAGSAHSAASESVPCTPSPKTLSVHALPVIANDCSPAAPDARSEFALCSCQSIHVGGALTVGQAATDPSGIGAIPAGSVGANSHVTVGGVTAVSGSLVSAGTDNSHFGGLMTVGSDFASQGDAHVGGLATIGRDAKLGEDLFALGIIRVGGDLYQPRGANTAGLAFMNVRGEIVQDANWTVPSPCNCDPAQQLDIAQAVEQAASANDNASIGLEADPAIRAIVLGELLHLPTGRFYLKSLLSAGAMTLHVSGNASLFIDGDLAIAGLLSVSIDPGAELNLFINGNWVDAGLSRIGNPRNPQPFRAFVAGRQEVVIAGAHAYVGNLYAPEATVRVGGVGQIHGSLFAREILAAGLLSVQHRTNRPQFDDCPGSPPADTDSPPTPLPPAADDDPSSDDPSTPVADDEPSEDEPLAPAADDEPSHDEPLEPPSKPCPAQPPAALR